MEGLSFLLCPFPPCTHSTFGESECEPRLLTSLSAVVWSSSLFPAKGQASLDGFTWVLIPRQSPLA